MMENDILSSSILLDSIILKLKNENSSEINRNLSELKKLYQLYDNKDALALIENVFAELKYAFPQLRTIGKSKSDELYYIQECLKMYNGWGQTYVNSNGKRSFKHFSENHRYIFLKCVEWFRNWLRNADGKRLVFENINGDLIYKKYKTRFTDNGRKATLREKYEELFSNGSILYKEATFLTLTTDPSKFPSMYDANQAMSKNWNKMATYIKKHFKNKDKEKKITFINVREFQKNGRLHMHIIIFGVTLYQNLIDRNRGIFTNRLIQNAWEKYGQGSITNTIPLSFDKGTQELTWYRGNRPSDCKKNEKPEDYLKKYLRKALEGNPIRYNSEIPYEKALDDYLNEIFEISCKENIDTETATAILNAESLFQYFGNNCRFYTYSPRLMSEEYAQKQKELKEIKKRLSEKFPLILVGIYDVNTEIVKLVSSPG